MSTINNTVLTAADVKALDVDALLDSLFAASNGGDIRDILAGGIVQIDAFEKAEAKEAKASRKMARKVAREERRIENADVNLHRGKAVIYGLCCGAFAAGAVATRNPLIAGLAVTSGIRTVRSTQQMMAAIKVRNALRDGAIIEEDARAELLALRNNLAFEGVLALVDAGLMAGLGVQQKDPVWHVLAGIDLLAAAFAGVGIGAVQRGLNSLDPKPAKPAKPGVHKAVKGEFAEAN